MPRTRSQVNKQVHKEINLPIAKMVNVKNNQLYPTAMAIPQSVTFPEPVSHNTVPTLPLPTLPVPTVPVPVPTVPVHDKHYLANINRHTRDDIASTITLPNVGTVYGMYHNKRGFISPSKFIHHFAAPFDADAIIAKIIASNNPRYEGMTPAEIKFKWDRDSKQACADGTKMHNAIELYYNQVPGVKKPSAWEGLEDECSQFDEFIAFQEASGLVPFRTEWQVYNEDTRLAGFIDMLFKNNNGGYEIYDWKRVKEIKKSGYSQLRHSALCHLGDCNYWHYTIQLNLYKHILENKYDMRIDGMYLVEFYPGKKLQRHQCPSLETELNEVFDSFKTLSGTSSN
jgi:hypothetical protein